jgi:hypothetical protein
MLQYSAISAETLARTTDGLQKHLAILISQDAMQKL